MVTVSRSSVFQRNLLLSIGGVFLLFAICFCIYQYQREKEYKIDILHSRLQMYNYDIMQVLGQAADITGGSKAENKKLFDLVKSLKLPFDQLIWENGGVWVHVSCGPRNRRQVLSISK